MYIATDVSSTMSWIVNMLVSGVRSCYQWMASIEFAGTNLLIVLVTITILGAFVPVLLSIPNNAGVRTEKYITRQEKGKKHK